MRFGSPRTIYKTVIFLDTNTIFHCKDLEQLPWSEIDAEGPILLLAVDTVVSEVDRKKQDGRLSSRARAFNRLIRPLAEDDTPVSISDTPVRVDLLVPYIRKVDWTAHPGLDRDEGDDRIIAEILNIPGMGEQNRLVVSNDTGFLIKAKRHGIKRKAVDESWLAKPEANPYEKKIATQEKELRELRKDEPQFSVICELRPGVSNLIYKVSAANENLQDEISRYLLAKHPKLEHNSPVSVFTDLLSRQYDPSYDGRYVKYAKQEVPRFAALYHRYLELHYGQKPFIIRVENTGKVIAKDIHIEVSVVNGWAHHLPIYIPLPEGPGAPRPEIQDRNLLAGRDINWRNLNIHPTASHEFDVDEVKHSTIFSARCEDFRQNKSWDLKRGVLFLDPATQPECKIIIQISASNLKGVITLPFSFSKELDTRTIEELVDFDECRLRAHSSVEELGLDPYEMDLDFEIDPPLSKRF
jgi:hypothetical protein